MRVVVVLLLLRATATAAATTLLRLRLQLPRSIEQRCVLGEPIAHEVAPAPERWKREPVADGVTADERGHEQRARRSRHGSASGWRRGAKTDSKSYDVIR